MANEIDTTSATNGTVTDCAPCGLHQPVRNAYYDGKMLTARDLGAEQTYLNGMRHLGNMLMHGAGTICGLKVTQHPQESCRATHVVLEPGMALTCCGQEVVVPNKVTIPIFDLINKDPVLQEQLRLAENTLQIGLCRKDTPAELGPVLIADCCSGLEGQLPARIAEDFGFELLAIPNVKLIEARTVLQPEMTWNCSINTGDEVPVAVSVDEEESQVYIASRSADGSSVIRIYEVATHRHVATLTGWDEIHDIATPRVGSFVYVAGLRGSDSVLAAYPRNPHHLSTEVHSVNLNGPGQIAVSPVSGAVFVLHYRGVGTGYRLWGWSAEQVVADITDPTVTLSKDLRMNTAAMDARCRVIEVSPDGRHLALATRGVNTDSASTLRIARVSELLGGEVVDLNDTSIAIRNENGEDTTAAYTDTASIRYSYDGELLHVTTREGVDDAVINYRAVAISESGYTQRGGGLTHPMPGLASMMPALHVAPDERWFYINGVLPPGSGEGDEDGRVSVFTTDNAHAPGVAPVEDEAIATLLLNARLSGGVMRARGERLYVPGTQQLGNSDDGAITPVSGRVMAVDISEANIAGLFEECVNGCRTCNDDCCCVTLAHVPDYVWNSEALMRIVDKDKGLAGEIEIENLLYRELAPSNAKLMQAILEIAARSVDAGPPGPRGRDGAAGVSGNNVSEVVYDDAISEPVIEDLGDGNLRLRLPEPEAGTDGNIISEVVYDPLISEPVLEALVGNNQRLRLPIPIDNVVYRDVLAPSMGSAAGEERTLILPTPESVGAGPRDPAEYHFVENINWEHGQTFRLVSEPPPETMIIQLNLPVTDPDFLFNLNNDVLVFSGVLEVRVQLQHDLFTDLSFDLQRVATLPYSPPVTSTDEALESNKDIVLNMQPLWIALRSYWRSQEARGALARIQLVLHGSFLTNEKGWPFDGRPEPAATPQSAGFTGGTWRSWIDVVQDL